MSTDSASGRAPTASACEPYREVTDAALGLKRNVVTIYQDPVVRRLHAVVRDGLARLSHDCAAALR